MVITVNYEKLWELKNKYWSNKKTSPEVLRFVSHHLKTKKTFKNPFKMLLFVVRYVTDWYKTQEMYDKIILENGGTLMMILSLLIKILIMSHSLVMVWIPILTLMMLILPMIILKLSFMLNLWLGVIDANNTRYVKLKCAKN